MTQMVLTEVSDLKLAIKAAIKELNEETATEKEKAANADKLYTVNEVRKRLGKAHNTIKKLVAKGLIKTTIDGLISEQSINDYLQKS